MHDINTLKAVEHRGCKVYIRNFNNIFEYLAIVNGQLYTAHIVVNRTPLQALLRKPYTEKQLTDTCKFLMNTAEVTIDTLLDRDK